MDNVLLYFSLKYNGNWMSIYKALDEKEKIESRDLIKVSNTIPNNFISIINPLYPSSLKQITEPSFVLYFKGSISLLHNFHQTIAFIGGDFVDKYNRQAVIKIVKDLIKENRIILLSDETAMQSIILECIIQNKGKVIIVTNKSLVDYLKNSTFIKKNLEDADYLILSETEKSSMFQNDSFSTLDVNNCKIVSGLSKAIIILENKNHEELANLLHIMNDDGKKIFAIPQPIIQKEESISNKLLKENAELIETAQDILNKI